MEELSKPKNFNENLNFKMSNMNMKINIKAMKRTGNIVNSSWIEQAKFNSYTLPTFTNAPAILPNDFFGTAISALLALVLSKNIC